jgi:uncharacterized protein (UPF0333 family)
LNFRVAFVLLVLALVLAIPAFTIPTVLSAETNDTITVNVTISAYAQITVLPTSITWTQNPNTDGTTYNVTIKNTGSVNLSQIYVSSNTTGDETTNPIPAGVASEYSASGFIFIKNSTATAPYHVGRQEWNLSDVLSGETLNLAGATEKWGHGWYKNVSSGNYLWKVENGTDGYCNDTNTVFKIKTLQENSTTQQRDLSSGLATESFGTAGVNWATFTFTDGPLSGYCLATYKDCDRIFIYKYDQSSAYPTCSAVQYLRAGVLVPGVEASAWVFASVPQGIPAGETALSILTFVATYA